MTKTTLYLDVDGVLNASFNGAKWGQGTRMAGVAEPKFDSFGAPAGIRHRFNMLWNSRLVDALNTLDVDLAWLTTWRADAPGVVAPLMGINLKGRVLPPESGETTFPSIAWKVESLLDDLRHHETERFIWIDDEIDPSIAKAVKDLHPQGLLIGPDPNWGITPGDIERIKTYLA